jgi:hypothetical protein
MIDESELEFGQAKREELNDNSGKNLRKTKSEIEKDAEDLSQMLYECQKQQKVM